jgi:hypothetical protein
MNKNRPEFIENVTGSIFSIARYYGGMTLHGEFYAYDPATDTLTRGDLVKKSKKSKKQKSGTPLATNSPIDR